MGDEITSHNQSGGVTAHTVSVSGGMHINQAAPKESRRSPWEKWGAIAGIIAAVVALLTYLNWTPSAIQAPSAPNPASSPAPDSKVLDISKANPVPPKTKNADAARTSKPAKPKQPPEEASVSKEDKVSVTSYNQSGGITAHTYINQADPARRLTSEQSASIQHAAKLSCAFIGHISVTASNGNHEAQTLAMDFVNAFRSAGCSADLELPIPGLTPDVTAIHIAVRDIPNDSAEARALGDILSSAGIKYLVNTMKPDFFPNNKFVLVIGAKQ